MTLSASLQYELVTCPVLQCFIHRIILVASNIKTQGISEAFRKQDIWQNVVEGSYINEKIEYPHNQKSSCRRLPSSSYSLSFSFFLSPNHRDPLNYEKNRIIYIASCLTAYLSPLMATQKDLYLASMYFWGRKSNPLKCINVVRD